MESSLLTTIGLIYDIIGAIIIWRFGLPQKVDRNGNIYLILEQQDEAEAKKAKIYDDVSRIGLILLVSGFAYQIVAEWIR